MKTKTLVVPAGLLVFRVGTQSVLFDSDNAPVHTPLPISLTVGGITTRFSATGQGFSVQPADSLGFTPVGFAAAAAIRAAFMPPICSSLSLRR
jgi:hypothetical protein